MSSWLFSLIMDGVVRRVNAMVLGREVGLQSGKGRVQLLSGDDTVLVAVSSKKLQKLVSEFGIV